MEMMNLSLSHVLFRIDFVVWKYVCLFVFCSDYMYVSMTLCVCMVLI